MDKLSVFSIFLFLMKFIGAAILVVVALAFIGFSILFVIGVVREVSKSIKEKKGKDK